MLGASLNATAHVDHTLDPHTDDAVYEEVNLQDMEFDEIEEVMDAIRVEFVQQGATSVCPRSMSLRTRAPIASLTLYLYADEVETGIHIPMPMRRRIPHLAFSNHGRRSHCTLSKLHSTDSHHRH